MSDNSPIARITCREVNAMFVTDVITDSFDLEPPGDGFRINEFESGKLSSSRKVESGYQFDLIPGQVINVGRTTDGTRCDITIDSQFVSRSHFTIWSVTYDFDGENTQPPLIFVRDCASLEGTFLNAKSIGVRAEPPRTGRLLDQHGGYIQVSPYWEFQVEPLLSVEGAKEVDLFKGKYDITTRRLGAGGFGSVYLAKNVRTNRQLACKIYNLDNPQFKAAMRQRFFGEVNMLKKIKHPNVLSFSHAFYSPHTLYTFTELATGGDLFSMCQSSRVFHGIFFGENEAKLVMWQVVSAVYHLHKHQIAHRDLKPENIFFAAGPGIRSGRVVLGDLGFTKDMSQSRTHSAAGTVSYAAPELREGVAYDFAVDVWSMGLLALFVLLPSQFDIDHRELTDQSQLDKILNDEFQNLEAQSRGISPSAKQFIRSCLILDPRHRMSSAEAKAHEWFSQQPERRAMRKLVKELDIMWRPASRKVTAIDEISDVDPGQTKARRRFSNRNLTVLDSQESLQLDAPVEDKSDDESDPVTTKRKFVNGSVTIPDSYETHQLDAAEPQESPYFNTPSSSAAAAKRPKLVHPEH
ncbi:protein kinase-like protein [Xylariomycetidae sp. FL2044]|nr:protein kinase-like protein [Xylariomycetidae sp. FL2044]